MITFETVGHEVYHGEPRVIAAIERLNAVGYSGILDVTKQVQIDKPSVPLEIIMPSSHTGEPFSSFEQGFVLNVNGIACGHRLPQARIMNALIAEITEMPVIAVPMSNREWHGTLIPDVTKGWTRLSEEQKKRAGLNQLDAFAEHVLETIEKFVDTNNGAGTAYVTGTSAGSAVGLSLAHKSQKMFDRGDVSVIAVPNVERRHLYKDLLVKDFASSGEGMETQVSDGPVKLLPLVRESGFENGPKTRLKNISDTIDFLTRDLFGFWPVDRNFRLNRNNVSLGKSLSVPTALQQIDRLGRQNDYSSPTVNVAYLELDTVARHEKLKRLAAKHTTPKHATFSLFEGIGHSGCNNPYIIGYMASLLTRNTSGIDTAQI